MSFLEPYVYAVIPVFNRLQFTRTCVELLQSQTYQSLRIIVVDGGSTDDTVAVLRDYYPDVTLLQGEEELWWAGAMHLGIQHVLEHSSRDDDFVLMMNNDTEFDRDYVANMVRVARNTDAAVGALIVDSRDPTHILDAGEFIDWSIYAFPVKTTIHAGETFCDRVDVLPGRGSLVPLRMIRAAGNVDCARFPHYIADYEFFARLRYHGFRLLVTYETSIRAHIGETGLLLNSERMTMRAVWALLFSTKSMSNVQDHWRFIGSCAPVQLRGTLRTQLVIRSLLIWFHRTWLRHLLMPVSLVRRCILFALRVLQLTYKGLSTAYYVTTRDCEDFGLDPSALVDCGVLEPWRKEGWYQFTEPRPNWRTLQSPLRRLLLRAWNPTTKPRRWFEARKYQQAAGSDLLHHGPVADS
jgi:GT2 family glycosyltransferase